MLTSSPSPVPEPVYGQYQWFGEASTYRSSSHLNRVSSNGEGDFVHTREDDVCVRDSSGRFTSLLEKSMSGIATLSLTFVGRDVVVTGDADRVVRVWDLRLNTHKELQGHAGAIFGVCGISPTSVASASEDKTIRLWDLKTSEPGMQLTGHTKEVHALTTDRMGRLASVSRDNSAIVWDLESGRDVKKLDQGLSMFNWMSSVESLGQSILIGSADGKITLWDPDSGTSDSFSAHSNESVTALASNEESNYFYSGSSNGTVKAWDIRRVNEAAATFTRGSEVSDLELSGKRLLVANDQGILVTSLYET